MPADQGLGPQQVALVILLHAGKQGDIKALKNHLELDVGGSGLCLFSKRLAQLEEEIYKQQPEESASSEAASEDVVDAEVVDDDKK